MSRAKAGIRVSLDTDSKNLVLHFPIEDNEVRIQVFHVSGTMVAEQPAGDIISRQAMTLSVSLWKSGMYVLKVTGKKYNESVKIII